MKEYFEQKIKEFDFREASLSDNLQRYMFNVKSDVAYTLAEG